MRVSLRTKIFLALLLSSLISHGVAALVIYDRMYQLAEGEAQAADQISARAAQTAIDRSERMFLAAAAAVAMEPMTAPSILGTARATNLPSAPLHAFGVDTFYEVDRGRVAVAGYSNGRVVAGEVITQPGLLVALAGHPTWSFQTDGAQIDLEGIAPVQSNGQVIGAVVVGGPLDQRFVEQVKGMTGLDSSLINPEGRSFASTLPPVEIAPAPTIAPTPTPVHPVAGDDPIINPTVRQVIVDQETLAPYTQALQDPSGRTPAYLVVWTPLGPVQRILAGLAHQMLYLILLILCTDVVIAWIVSSALTRELRQLTLAARRIATGDYEHPADVHANDEIGDLARAFEDMRVRVGEADRLKSAFISTVSHELRSPIGHIKGYAQLLLAEAVDEATWREYLQIIEAAADRMAELVNNILDVSLIAAGPLVLNCEPIAIRPILEQQVERLRRHDPERTVTLDVAVGVPPVNADPARLVQVIRALLDNAKQYSPSASPIVVRCYVDDLRGKVDRDGAAHAVVVEIEDRGVGIASAEQARIFEPFSRVDEGLNRQSQGCGMGLTIARGIIRAHGGRMWVVSTPEQGSTFGFYIPA